MEKFSLKKMDLYLSALLLFIMSMIIVFQIVTRFFNIPFSWPDEVARFLNIWMAFIVLSGAAKMDIHVKIDFFINKLPNIFKNTIENLTQLLNCFVSIFVVISALLYMEKIWSVKSSAASIPVPLYFVATIIGMVMLAIVYLVRFIQGVKKI